MSVEFCPRYPRTVDLKLLTVRAREDFYLGADRGLVVVEALSARRSQLFLFPPSLRSSTAGP